MQSQHTNTSHQQAVSSKLNKFDLAWVLNLFGTAVGAGVLFLPINAGMSGFWPLVAMAVIVGPMTYFSHRGLARFVLSSAKPGSDITEVVEEHFGKTAGKLITLLYFFAIFPILLIYGNGITNTVDSFLVNQLGMASPPRVLLSFVLIASLIGVLLLGERFVLKVTEWLVYPLILILFVLSVYLIPEWNTSSLTTIPSAGTFLSTLWITIPVLVFSFNHSPAISSFVLSQQREYQDGELTD
ncbi:MULTISPECIES: aromatic amino acid transport family protein [unclassified Eikenella]|uniref:aromatic amino acid transport family protein n=1 Tax=unclassified Eikenella TaxID=2639367 RepID=UPI000A9CC0CB|nr:MULTISPECIES: aromatic amino acid transport family protein [unclassified Eikenella]